MSLVRHTAWSAAATLVTIAGRLAIISVLAHRLGPTLFGTFVFAQWLVETSFLVFSFGLAGIATRFFPQASAAATGSSALAGFEAWFARAMLLVVGLTALSATVAFVLFGGTTAGSAVAAVALWSVSSAVWTLASARTQGRAEFGVLTFCSSLSIALTLVALLPEHSRGNLAWAIVATASMQLVAGIVCLVAGTRPRATAQPSLDTGERARIRDYGRNVWITSLFSTLVSTRGELPLVKGYLGDSFVGHYSGGITITGLVNQSVALLTGGLNPTMARLFDAGEYPHLLQLSAAITRLLSFIAGVTVGVVICFSHTIVRLALGPEFLDVAPLLGVLALGSLSVTIGCPNLIVQFSTNARFTRNGNVIAAVALYALVAVLTPVYGLTGAAAGRSFIQLAMAAATLWWLRRVFGPGAKFAIQAVTLLLLVISCAILAAVFPEGPVPLATSFLACIAFASLSAVVATAGAPTKLMSDLRYVLDFRSGSRARTIGYPAASP